MKWLQPDGSYGMYQWGMVNIPEGDKCTHPPLSEADFVALMVDTWGGSWQGLYKNLAQKGYGLIKT